MTWFTKQLSDGRFFHAGRVYREIPLPKEDSLPEEYRGKIVDVMYGSITGTEREHSGGTQAMIVESEGMERLVFEKGKWNGVDPNLKPVFTIADRIANEAGGF
ncbi:MAG: hypothetical protein JSW08_02450 [archaeon]|nr:MAG: hypothetical protein JSW08_02450 [archaeon]